MEHVQTPQLYVYRRGSKYVYDDGLAIINSISILPFPVSINHNAARTLKIAYRCIICPPITVEYIYLVWTRILM
jgi:hypothetical protein